MAAACGWVEDLSEYCALLRCGRFGTHKLVHLQVDKSDMTVCLAIPLAFGCETVS